MTRFLRLLAALAALALSSPVAAQGVISPGDVIGNGTASSRAASRATLGSVMDQALGATNNRVAYRTGGVWTAFDIFGTAHTWTATQTINPTPASINAGIVVTQTSPVAASTTGPFAYNSYNISSTESATTAGFTRGAPNAFIAGVKLDYFTGSTNVGATFQAAFYASMNVTLAATTQAQAYAIYAPAYANVTNSVATAGIGGVNGTAIVGPSGSVAIVEGLEAETGIQTGGAASIRAGVFIDAIGNVQASVIDAAIVVGNYTGWNGSTNGGAYKDFVVFTSAAGANGGPVGLPLDPTGSVFRSDAAFSITNFASMSNVTVTGNIANFATWQVTGAGVHWDKQLTVGTTNVTPDAPLTVMGNTAATVAPFTGTLLHVVSPDATVATISTDSFASQGVLLGRRADGTLASKSAVAADALLFQFGANAYDGGSYPSTGTGIISIRALGLQSGTNHGSYITFQTTPSGSTTTTEMMRIYGTTGVNIGPAVIPDALLTVMANTAATVAPSIAGTNLHIAGADATINTAQWDSFAAQNVILGRRANGTLASKTAVGSGTTLFQVGAQSWDGSAYTTIGIMDVLTVDAQTATDHSSRFRWQTISTGVSAAIGEVMSVGQGLNVGSSFTDPGANNIRAAGTINAVGGFLNNGTAATGSGGGVVLATSPVITTPAIAQIYGGSLANSTLALTSTSNGAPSGDTVTVTVNGNQTTTFKTAAANVYGITINQNAVAIPSLGFSAAGSLLSAPNGSVAGHNIITYASIGLNTFVRANTSATAPSALASGDVIGGMASAGYDSTPAWTGLTGAARFVANEAWTNTAHGTRFEVLLVPSGSTSFPGASQLYVYPSGGIAVNTASDPGAGLIYTNSASFMIRTKTTYNNGAGANTATLTNAPAATNPTKWIPVDDNGTTRYVPAW